MDLNKLPAYVQTPEDIANNAAEDAWKERRREADRRVLVSRVERERRVAVRRCVDAWAARNAAPAAPAPKFAIGNEVDLLGGGSFLVTKITATQYATGGWWYSYHGLGIIADESRLVGGAA